MCGVDDQVKQFVERRINVDDVHPWCCDHHIASRHIGHAYDAFEHLAALCAYDFIVLRFDQGLYQLVFRVGAGVKHFS